MRLNLGAVHHRRKKQTEDEKVELSLFKTLERLDLCRVRRIDPMFVSYVDPMFVTYTDPMFVTYVERGYMTFECG